MINIAITDQDLLLKTLGFFGGLSQMNLFNLYWDTLPSNRLGEITFFTVPINSHSETKNVPDTALLAIAISYTYTVLGFLPLSLSD